MTDAACVHPDATSRGRGHAAREHHPECTECRTATTYGQELERKHPERVEWKKYCPRCNKHQTHKESK
ncbi:MAG: 50S ribosomal protein L33 [Gemmatimonadetes bacterium]|nr:50S ribosomal protein L33 [Gemmatimonadota bacterium]